MKRKTKKILIIALSIMLVGVIGAMGAIFGKNDWAKVKNKINNLKQESVEKVNYLYNSDFSINTTSIDVFTQENAGTDKAPYMDGWHNNYHLADSFAIMSTTNGLYVKNTSETENVNVCQNIQNHENLLGVSSTLTFSVNGIVYSKTFTIEDYGNYVLETDQLCFSMLYNSANYPIIQCTMAFSPGFEGIVNWIQVELGDTFTGYTQGPSSYVNPVV